MRMLFVLLLVAGLFSALATGVGAACPQQAPAAMPMMHHHSHGAPARPDPSACAVCLAIVPAVPPVDRPASSPLAALASAARPLAGIDRSIDPPPPRAA